MWCCLNVNKIETSKRTNAVPWWAIPSAVSIMCCPNSKMSSDPCSRSTSCCSCNAVIFLLILCSSLNCLMCLSALVTTFRTPLDGNSRPLLFLNSISWYAVVNCLGASVVTHAHRQDEHLSMLRALRTTQPE